MNTVQRLNRFKKRFQESPRFEVLEKLVQRVQERLNLSVQAAPGYFRTNNEVFQAMRDLASKYPERATVETVGVSGDKRAGKGGFDMLTLRLGTPKPGQARKPVLMVIAGEHAREIANPEIVMRWATRLLEGYGKDAEATALLDRYELVFIPVVNPDGHKVVEDGYATGNRSKLMQRKNTQGPGSGVDINRNYPFRWGGPGASTSPNSETYRGKSAGSEAETQAVIQTAEKVKPDFFLSLHSYSELVLYAWGDTKEKAPDHDGLKAFSDAMGLMTDEGGDKYSSIQSIDLYATTGTSSDHMYGALHIPAITIETGTTFHQNDAEFEETWREVSPVLDYSAKLTEGAYKLGHGPIVRDVKVDGSQVVAQVHDLYNGGQKIAAAEAVTDLSTPFGQGVQLKAADGAFDSPKETATGDISQLNGKLVYVRAKDSNGNWGTWAVDWNAPKQAPAQA